MSRRVWASLLALGALWPPTGAAAQRVVMEQVVSLRLEVRDDSVVALLNVPATALSDIGGPSLANPSLNPNSSANAVPLAELVTTAPASIAYDLDIWQDGTPLSLTSGQASVGADMSSLDVRLAFALGAGLDGVSARLNTFTGTLSAPVRTDVTYVPSGGGEQLLSLRGDPTRVRFDPGPLETIREFLVRAVRSLLLEGDHLLFLACLLLPVRRLKDASGLFAAVIAAQAVTMTASLFLPLVGTLALPFGMIGASVVVMAGAQAIVGAGIGWTRILAIAFGVASGLMVGDTLSAEAQFAGSHVWIAATIFLGVVVIGELWLGTLAWLARVWLHDRGAPERMVIVLGSVLIIHTALHRVLDRGYDLASATGLDAESAIVWLALGWGVVMALVAAAQALRQGAAAGGSHDTRQVAHR